MHLIWRFQSGTHAPAIGEANTVSGFFFLASVLIEFCPRQVENGQHIGSEKGLNLGGHKV